MKTILFFTLAFLCFEIGIAQTTKTYNGPFELSHPFVQNGTATYSYYDDTKTYERVKNGPFAFTFTGQGNFKGWNETIKGEYKKNLKHGQWVFTITTNDFKTGNYYKTGTIKLMAFGNSLLMGKAGKGYITEIHENLNSDHLESLIRQNCKQISPMVF